MSISKNVFGLALGALLVTGAETSLAASAPATGSNTTEEEVLFKIHDISPVKNSDGEVIACDFNATFYNRSPYEVSDAVVSLTWNDQSLENIIKSENKTALLVTHDISEAISLADKVIILSMRPSYVKKILNIDLTSYGSPLKRREAQEFRTLFDEIWKEIQYDKKEENKG